MRMLQFGIPQRHSSFLPDPPQNSPGGEPQGSRCGLCRANLAKEPGVPITIWRQRGYPLMNDLFILQFASAIVKRRSGSQNSTICQRYPAVRQFRQGSQTAIRRHRRMGRDLQAICLATGDAAEGQVAFKEKRPRVSAADRASRGCGMTRSGSCATRIATDALDMYIGGVRSEHLRPSSSGQDAALSRR